MDPTSVSQTTLIRSGQTWWQTALPQGQALETCVTALTRQRELNPDQHMDMQPPDAPLSPGLLAAAGVQGPWSGHALHWATLTTGPGVSWSHLPGLSPQEQRPLTSQPDLIGLDLTWNVHPAPPAAGLSTTDWLRDWLRDARAQLRSGLQLLREEHSHTPQISHELLAALSLPAHLALLQEEALATDLGDTRLSVSAPVALSLLRALACADELARERAPLSMNRRARAPLRLPATPGPIPHLLLTLTRAATQWAERAGARDQAAYSSQISLWLLSPTWMQRTVTWTGRRWWALRRHGMPSAGLVDEQLISDWLPALASIPLSQGTRDWRLKVTVSASVASERYGLQSIPAVPTPGLKGAALPGSVRPPRPWPAEGQTQAQACAEALAMEQAWGQEPTRPWAASPLRPTDLMMVRGQARGEIERLLHSGQDTSHVGPHWLLTPSVPACFMPPPSELHAQATQFIRSGGVTGPRALRALSDLARMWSETTCLHAGLDALAPLAEAEDRCARQLARLCGSLHDPATRIMPLTPPICLSDTQLWELEETYTHTTRQAAAFGLGHHLN